MASTEEAGVGQPNLASIVETIRKRLYSVTSKSQQILHTLEGPPQPDDLSPDKAEPKTYRARLHEINHMLGELDDNLDHISGSLGCHYPKPVNGANEKQLRPY